VATLVVAPVPPPAPARRLRPGFRRFRELEAAAPVGGHELGVGELVRRLRALVVMNDWGTTRPLVEQARAQRVPTFGWVEGVQDFDDLDTGRDRRAYRSVDQVWCLGDFDRRHLREQSTVIVGSQRLQSLWVAPATSPSGQFATINSNFTYGVQTSARRAWVADAVAGCRNADAQWALSRHVAERGLAFPYRPSQRPASELLGESSHLISRFSTLCLEALVRGVTVVFHNPHGERSAGFPHLDGALIPTVDRHGIASALNVGGRGDGVAVRNAASDWLNDRLHLPVVPDAARRAADAVLAEVGTPS